MIITLGNVELGVVCIKKPLFIQKQGSELLLSCFVLLIPNGLKLTFLNRPEMQFDES